MPLAKRLNVPGYSRQDTMNSITIVIVSALTNEHNHAPARDVRVYTQHRKLSEHALRDAATMIKAGASNRTIVRKLDSDNVPLLSKDISNLRPKLANKFVDVKDMIEHLQSSGYFVYWH